jgi:hypothetical protein
MKKVVALITRTEANMRRCRTSNADVSTEPWQQLSLINLLSHRLHSNVRWPKADIQSESCEIGLPSELLATAQFARIYLQQSAHKQPMRN